MGKAERKSEGTLIIKRVEGEGAQNKLQGAIAAGPNLTYKRTFVCKHKPRANFD